MTDATDRELIALVAEGDRDAFSELMARTEDMVFAVCMRIMGNRETARDATQETFVTLFRKADRYKGTAAVTTWLYRVTVNTCYDMLRKAKRRHADSLPDHVDPADPQASVIPAPRSQVRMMMCSGDTTLATVILARSGKIGWFSRSGPKRSRS